MESSRQSEQPKYRRGAVVLVSLLVLWVGAWAGAGFGQVVKPEVALMAGFVGGFMLLIFVIVVLTQLSQAKINDLLAARGFMSVASSTSFWRGLSVNLPPDINEMFRASANVGSSGRVYRAAVRTDERGETWFIRHIIQHGKTSTTRNIVLMRAVENWPRVRVHRKGIVDAVKKLLGEKRVLLENAEFNDRMAVSCDDADFAMLLMGPELQQAVMGLGLADEVVIGGGAICVIGMTMMSVKQCEKQLETAEAVRAAIPPEMAEWGKA